MRIFVDFCGDFKFTVDDFRLLEFLKQTLFFVLSNDFFATVVSVQ
jgi:hypothetical protein